MGLVDLVSWVGPDGLVGICESCGSVWDGEPGGSSGLSPMVLFLIGLLNSLLNPCNV